jgi:hypothetical protein
MDRVITKGDDATCEAVLGEVRELCRRFPAPGVGAVSQR